MNRVKTFMGREILVEFALLFEGARRSVRSRYVSTPRRGNGAKAARKRPAPLLSGVFGYLVHKRFKPGRNIRFALAVVGHVNTGTSYLFWMSFRIALEMVPGIQVKGMALMMPEAPLGIKSMLLPTLSMASPSKLSSIYGMA